MAMVCDVYGTKFARDTSGHATLHVSPPRPDFKLISALVIAGKPYETPDHLALDLCLGCTAKTLAHLGLPTDICELPEMPAVPSAMPIDGDGSPPAGALTLDDLKQLGIVLSGDELSQLAVAPDNGDPIAK